MWYYQNVVIKFISNYTSRQALDVWNFVEINGFFRQLMSSVSQMSSAAGEEEEEDEVEEAEVPFMDDLKGEPALEVQSASCKYSRSFGTLQTPLLAQSNCRRPFQLLISNSIFLNTHSIKLHSSAAISTLSCEYCVLLSFILQINFAI